jgi:tRNA nucleotidyltransferase (CCA-adding enzyme)
MLGRAVADIDIAVESDAARFGRLLARELGGIFKSYSQFGTGTVSLQGSGVRDQRRVDHIDIARTRTESYASPAALPTVSAAEIRADLRRRDFTINAMAWRLTRPQATSLVDPFGGLADLRRGLIRVLHDKSFEDDPTRIFRAVRFAGRFGFRLEPGTAFLMNRAIGQGRLKLLSGKRLLTELALVMQERNAAPILRGFDQKGVFVSVFGQRLARDCPAQVGRISDSGLRLIFLLSGLKRRSGIPLTREQRADLASLAAFSRRRKVLGRAGKPSQVYEALKDQARNALRIRAALESKAIARKIGDYLDVYSTGKSLLQGSDLKALGIAPGPAYARLLKKLRAARLDGEVKTREDELRLVRKLERVRDQKPGVRGQGTGRC